MTLHVGPSKLIFVWPTWCRQVVRGQKFGALSLLRCPSPMRPQIQPVRRKTVHWAVEWELSRKAEAFKVLSRYGCDMFPQNLWLPGTIKWGKYRHCLKEQVISGPKKTMWKKFGPRSQKCLFWFNLALKSKPPIIWNLEIPQKSMKTRFKLIK